MMRKPRTPARIHVLTDKTFELVDEPAIDLIADNG